MELHTPGMVDNLVILFLFSLPLLFVIAVIGILIKIVRSKSSRPYVKRIAGFSLTALCSIFITFATLNLPKTLNDPNQQNNMICGWPMPFMMFDGRRTPPDYPWTESCSGWAGSPMDTEKEIFWIPFLTNVTIAFGVIGAGVYLIRKLSKVKKEKTHLKFT